MSLSRLCEQSEEKTNTIVLLKKTNVFLMYYIFQKGKIYLEKSFVLEFDRI